MAYSKKTSSKERSIDRSRRNLGGTRFKTGRKYHWDVHETMNRRFCSQVPVMSEEEAEDRIDRLRLTEQKKSAFLKM